MRLQWVVITVCVCWLAILVQPQQCEELIAKETTEVGSINKIADDNRESLLSASEVVGAEAKVHIVGYNGQCVTVKNADYHDGNAIVLDECKSGEESQLWSMGSSDQTIQSNGKCLTTYGYNQGDYIMIYDCRKAATEAARWKIDSDNRKIINPKSGLSLTAVEDSGSSGGYKVLAYEYQYIPRQAWVASNKTKPPVVGLVGGFGELCLTLNGAQTVEMSRCDESREEEQRWAVYQDNTVRPEHRPDLCLRYEYGKYAVTVGGCQGLSNEGWVFYTDNGSIVHLSTGMALDIKATVDHFSPFLNCYEL